MWVYTRLWQEKVYTQGQFKLTQRNFVNSCINFGNSCIGFFETIRLTIYKTLLPSKKFGNINLSRQFYLKEFVTLLGLKFFLWKNRNFWFQKNSIQICIFNCNNVFLWDCMGKGACIKRMVAARNYSTNTIMEKKNKQRGRGV